jgi:hypothetical protein
MACCGRQTPGIGEPAAAAGQFRPSPASKAARTQAVPRTQVYFEYVGGTGMTAIGSVTGRRYRFERAGARVAVDPVDKPSLAKVPRLKPVPGP